MANEQHLLHCISTLIQLSMYVSTTVFFNLFFEAEPFVAILIAHGTHKLSKEYVLWARCRPGGQKFKAEGGEGVIGSSQPAFGGIGSAVRSPAGFSAKPSLQCFCN